MNRRTKQHLNVGLATLLGMQLAKGKAEIAEDKPLFNRHMFAGVCGQVAAIVQMALGGLDKGQMATFNHISGEMTPNHLAVMRVVACYLNGDIGVPDAVIKSIPDAELGAAIQVALDAFSQTQPSAYPEAAA